MLGRRNIGYLGRAFLAAVLGKVLDLKQELTALLIEMEEVIQSILLPTRHLSRLRHYERMLPLPLSATAANPLLFFFHLFLLLLALSLIIAVHRSLPMMMMLISLPPWSRPSLLLHLSPLVRCNHRLPFSSSAASRRLPLLLRWFPRQPCLIIYIYIYRSPPCSDEAGNFIKAVKVSPN